MSAVVDGAAQIFVPTTMLALAALGLLAAQNAGHTSRAAFVMLAAGLLTGAILIAFALREPPAAIALLVLAVLTGLSVATAQPLPAMAARALAFATGTALALNAPPQATTIPSAIGEQLGTGIAALAAFGLVALVAAKANRAWSRIGIRIAGSWIAATAIFVLALRVFR